MTNPQRDAAREVLERAQADYFQRHAARIKATQEGEEVAIIPPLALQVTAGLGKSHSVTQTALSCQKADLPLVILVPTHNLAEEYCQRFSQAGVYAAHYYGRQEPNNKIGEAWTCWKMDVVEVAGGKNHRPANSVCKTCAHGMRVESERGNERAVEFFRRRGEKPENYEKCRFLYEARPIQLEAQILVMPVQSFSENVGFWTQRDGITGAIIDRVQRLVIVDESIELAAPVQIRAGDVAEWRDGLPGLKERLQKTADALARVDGRTSEQERDLANARAMMDLLPDLDQLFSGMGAQIVQDGRPDVARILDSYKRAKKAGGLKSGGSAPWEKVALLDDGSYKIPLRALNVLAGNIQAGVLRTARNHWTVHELAPVIQWAQEHGSAVFMDATMPLAVRAIVEAAGGHLVDAAAPQHQQVVQYVGYLYARGQVGPGAYQRNAKSRLREIERIAAQLPKPSAILTHKATLRYARDDCDHPDAAERAAAEFEARTGVAIGWFGRDDRGHNRWAGKALALVGMPLLSRDAIAEAYGSVRAALAQAGIDWPEWSGQMTQAGDPQSPQGVPMPACDHVRAWLMDSYAQGIAQAVARNRAVNADSKNPLRVELWGGLSCAELDAALSRFGVVIHERRANTLHQTIESFYRRGSDIDAINRAVQAAAVAAEATGAGFNRETVRRLLAEMHITASNKAIDQAISTHRATNSNGANGAIPDRDAEKPKKRQEKPWEMTEIDREAWIEAWCERAAMIEQDGVERAIAELAAHEITVRELGLRPDPSA